MGNLSDRVSGTVKQVLAEITGSVDLKHEGEAQVFAGKHADEAAPVDEGDLDQIAQDDQQLYEHPQHGGSAPIQDVVGAEQAPTVAREHRAGGSGADQDDMGGLNTADPVAVTADRLRAGKV